MKILPRLSKIKFNAVNAEYRIPFQEMHYNLGQFYLSGDIKAEWSFNNQLKSIIFKQNDLAFSDSGLVNFKTCCIQKGSQDASYPYEEFENGWTLSSLTEKASFVCIQYLPNDIKNSNSLKTDTLSIYDYHILNSFKEIQVSKDDYLLVLQGKPLINGQEKQFKSWINFSSNQTISLDSPIDQSVIILFK